MTADEFLDSLASRLGVSAPDEATMTTLLDLAAVAAHGSERLAAPLACWMVGVAGADAETALQIARELTSDID